MNRLVVCFVLLCFGLASSQTCTSTYNGGPSPDCTNIEKPYCMLTTAPSVPTAVYECVQVRNHRAIY